MVSGTQPHCYQHLNRCRFLIGSVVLFLCLNGCSWLIQPPEDHPPARRLIQMAVEANTGLIQYKGLARAHLQIPGQSMRGRIALAAVAPNQMRIEWLSALGQPLTSLAGDGQHITVRMHDSGKIYRLPQLRDALERMINIPIGIEDLLSILAGRPPLPVYAAAQMEPASGASKQVILKNRWRGVLAKLELDSIRGRVKALKTFDGMGTMQYEVKWEQWQSLGGYVIPKQVVIRALGEQTLSLTVDRFWPNTDVDPETFVLTQPDNNS